MQSTQPTIEAGAIFEVPKPGTNEWQLVEVIATHGDEGFFCGGAPDAEDYVVARIDDRSPTAIKKLWFAGRRELV